MNKYESLALCAVNICYTVRHMDRDRQEIHNIGIFLDIPGLACNRAVAGFYRFARSRPGWRIYDFPVKRKSSDQRTLVRDFRPDAIFTSHADIIRDYARHGRRKIPYVLMDEVEPGFPGPRGAALNIDNAAIGRCAAQRLHALGYRNFAYLGMVFSSASSPSSSKMLSRYSQLRGGAFENAIAELGCASDTFSAGEKAQGIGNLKALRRWLKALRKPCGIMAFSDEDASFAIKACHEAGISIPRQIGFIGVDNETHFCENTTPPLTSVEPDYEGAGFKAAELLASLIEGDAKTGGSQHIYGVLKIEERMSAQSISAAANRVARARAAIRNAESRIPSPAEIARGQNVSLRVLELAFKEVLGRSMRSDILDFRLEKATKLLKATKLPIGEVAIKSGFENYAAFTTSFRRRLGMSPGAWRREQNRPSSR